MSSERAFAEPGQDEFAAYRSVSKPAVASLALAILSLPALLFPTLITIPLMGTVLAILALRNIRQFPNELSGKVPATLGLAGCSFLLLSSIAVHTVIYVTEVPEGYVRVHFFELQPDKRRPDLPVSPKALELNNQKIFVKGYVHPGVAGHGQIKHFVLVPDMGTCCFGGQPDKPTDMIEVKLRGPLAIRYSRTKRKLAGIFTVDTTPKSAAGLRNVYYQLEADYVR